MAGKPWTDAEVDAMTEGYIAGESPETIAGTRVPERTEAAVRAKVNGMNLHTGGSKRPIDEIRRLKRHAKTLQEQNDKLLAELKRKRAKLIIPTQKKRNRKAGALVRLIIPDTHGAHIDTAAAGAMFADAERLDPDEVLHLGDGLDCGGFLAKHHTLGFVPETATSYADDTDAANGFFDELAKRCPRAKVWYLEGNHEQRIEKWCINQALHGSGDKRDVERMIERNGCESVLSLKQRGIEYIKRGVFYQDLPTPGTVKLGHCFFMHGKTTAKHEAANMVKRYAANVVFGHIHRAQSHTTRTMRDGAIGASCPGCLCKLQPLWMDTNFTEWTHGYAYQIVSSNGEFMHVNVPIVNGKSLLSPLFGRAG